MKGLNTRIDRYQRNPKGRDIIVGDIHGHFGRLKTALATIGFDIHSDRLFSVGDLIDRGPESQESLAWLTFPWFKAVRGNHEEAAIAWARQEIERFHYERGFGAYWNTTAPFEFVLNRAVAFEKLPLAIELETERGLIGIVHACCPVPSWDEFARLMQEPEAGASGLVASRAQAAANAATWMHMDRRDRFFDGPVQGVHAVVVGHTEVERLTSWDNTHFIDTGGWNKGQFTLLDAATLLPADRPGRGLDWSNS